MNKLWQKLLLPKGENYLAWELFHENSKGSLYHEGPTNEVVLQKMGELHESLPFFGCPIIELPAPLKVLTFPLGQALSSRRSVRNFCSSSLDLEQLATILHFAYGVSLENNKNEAPRPFRMVPSGGELFPLEIFFHATQITGLTPGIYHYNPTQHHICLTQEGDATSKINMAMVQQGILKNVSLTVFISAIFERSIFKYGNRGYRFIFLESGHVAQNINLIAQALELGCLNIGGYFDRQVDDLLSFDGLTQSTIYIVAIGKPTELDGGKYSKSS